MSKFLDQVSHEQKALIKKTSSQRLFKWLADAGMSEDEAERLTREQLMKAWAEMVVTGKDKQEEEREEAQSVNGGENDNRLDEERLRFEKEKWEAELAMRREEMELKKREIDLKYDEVNSKKDREKTIVYRAKLFGDALRGTMTKMPQDAVELMPYF